MGVTASVGSEYYSLEFFLVVHSSDSGSFLKAIHWSVLCQILEGIFYISPDFFVYLSFLRSSTLWTLASLVFPVSYLCLLHPGICWAPLGFPLILLRSGNSTKGVIWGNLQASLACFLSPKDHCPLLHYAQMYNWKLLCHRSVRSLVVLCRRINLIFVTPS